MSDIFKKPLPFAQPQQASLEQEKLLPTSILPVTTPPLSQTAQTSDASLAMEQEPEPTHERIRPQLSLPTRSDGQPKAQPISSQPPFAQNEVSDTSSTAISHLPTASIPTVSNTPFHPLPDVPLTPLLETPFSLLPTHHLPSYQETHTPLPLEASGQFQPNLVNFSTLKRVEQEQALQQFPGRESIPFKPENASRSRRENAREAILEKREGRPPLPSHISDESKYLRSVPYFLLPPNQEEMYRYSKRNKWWLVIPSLFSFTGLCMSQLKFATASPYLWGFSLGLTFTFLYYFLSLIINLFTPDFDVVAHKQSIEQWKQDRLRDGQWPSVDVFLPICGEPIEVLRNTWKLVMEMCKRYPGKTTIYVLDDGNSAQAKEEAEKFQHVGFRYIVRPNRGVKKKAGNLKYGFEHSDGDAILIFDADFCPQREMIFHLLPTLWNNERVGIVQSPQYFRTSTQQNWLARGASAVQELFYRYVQVSRNHHKGAICVGSCALYRRAALASIGGPHQIEHSEDVWTGVMCYTKGWTLRYIPINLAVGLCPSDFNAFLRQQYRWCRGSMSLLFSKIFWRTSMPFVTRLCYISGFCYYCHTALFLFIAPAIPITLLLFLSQQIRWENYVYVIPSIIYSLIIFPLWHKSDYGLNGGLLDAMAAKLIYSWAHALTLIDLARGRPLGWQPTGSSAAKARATTHWHIKHAHLLLFSWGMLTSLVWLGLGGWRMSQSSQPWNFIPVLLVGTLNLLVVLKASSSTKN